MSLGPVVWAIGLASSAIIFVTPAHAVDLLSNSYALAVPATGTVHQAFACSDEQLISGGYAIETVSGGSMGDLTVTASTRDPDAAGSWLVGLYNHSTSTVTVELRISIMCD